jgi:hypothetical protein
LDTALPLETVEVDWVTLTTWDIKAYLDAIAAIRRSELGGWKGSKVQQYQGHSNGNIFYGIAEQRNANYEDKPHAMIRVSGADSDIWFRGWWLHSEFARSDAWKCTRLDLQSTRVPPDGLKMLDWYHKIKYPKNMVLGEKSTIYIGNRADSPIFVRLYEKLDFLRLELELKKKRATWAYRQMVHGTTAASVFQSALKKSRIPKYFYDYFTVSYEIIDYKNAQIKSEMTAKIKWLASLDGVVNMLINDDTVGRRARDIIQRWQDYSESYDA